MKEWNKPSVEQMAQINSLKRDFEDFDVSHQ